MKKLFSLILVALISSQMWAATQNMKVYFIYDDGGLTTKNINLCSISSCKTACNSSGSGGNSVTPTLGGTGNNRYYGFSTSSTSEYFTITLGTELDGWEFVKWVKDSNVGNSQLGTSKTLTTKKENIGSVTFSAVFRRKAITISATSAGNGTGQVSKTSGSGYTSSVSVTPSTTVYLKATPSSSSYVFDYWSNNQNSTKIYDASTSVTPSVATTYTAHFKAAPAPSTFSVSLSVSPEGAGVVSASPASSISSGGSSTLSVTSTTSGYTFDGWYENNSKLSGNSSYTLSSITANRTIVARFTPAPVNYTANPGENVMQCGTGITIPNIANAVDLGFGVLWAKKNVGASSVDYRGTRYTYAAAKALSASDLGGTGWRLPTYDEFSSSGLLVLDTHVDGNNFVFTRATGYNGVELIIATEGANLAEIWSSYESGNTRRVGRANRNTNTWTCINNIDMSTQASYEAWVRPVFDLAAAGIKKLTINVVKDGVTTTNNYYVANGQVVNITPASVSGYNSSWTSGASGTGAKDFTVTSNTTATITYTEAITYVTATFKNADNTTNFATQQVVSGQAPTAPSGSPAKASTVSTVYTFDRWNTAQDGTGNGISTAITAATTYYPIYTEAARTYTIRFLMDDGETVLSTAQVAYNGSPIEPSEPTKIGTEEYSYNFTGWTPAVTAVTGDQDYVAVFEQVAKAPKYDLTIGAFTNGSVTLTANGKTDVVPAAGGTYQYEEGTTIIVKAVPAKGYHFNQWNDANTAASRQVSEIAANMTLTPTFAVNAPFLMDDTWEQAAFISNCAAATGVLTVTLKDRTYSAGQWATLSVPFNCTLDQEDELYNAVYKLHTLTLAQDGGSVSFEFIRTNVVEANEPYLIVPRHDISEVIFHGVTLTTPAEVSRTTDDRVTFVSGLWKQTISGPNEFYVATGNSLRYASSLGTNVKGNRAFFRKIGDAASAPRRAIMVIDGEEVEVEIAGDAIEEVQDVRKYIENGVLIIERNGVRFNAQGQRAE